MSKNKEFTERRRVRRVAIGAWGLAGILLTGMATGQAPAGRLDSGMWHDTRSADTATLPDDHAGPDFNFRHKAIHIFGNFNYHTRTVTGEGSSQQHFLDDNAGYVEQEDRRRTENRELDTRMGMDYALNKRTTLTLTFVRADRLPI